MKLLDLYILRKVLATFFFVLLIFEAIIVVIDLTERVDKFTANKLSTIVILGYYGDFIPWIAGLLSPILVFIAVVYVTGRLAAHTELIAMLSSGISFNRLLFPYFVSALIVASITFVLNGWIIPHSNRERLEFELTYFKNRYYFDRQNIHMQVEPNVYLFIQNYNNQSNVGYQFTLEKFKDNKLVDKLTADNIVWDSTKQIWTLRYWKRMAVDSMFHLQPVSVSRALQSQGTDMDTALAISPKDFASDEGAYDGMTINELSDHIRKLKFRGSTGVEQYEVERHIRFAAPVTIFILIFMGVFVSARKARGGTGYQIVLGFVLAFVFLIFFLLSRTFAEAGSLSPLIAAWIPNIIFACIALLMYRYVPR